MRRGENRRGQKDRYFFERAEPGPEREDDGSGCAERGEQLNQ
jgi:hypothetical protein